MTGGDDDDDDDDDDDEGSLLHSQVPATCFYPEPTQSSPYPHIPLPESRNM
jgi:hypothetical protein